jgi:hypothetical protein
MQPLILGYWDLGTSAPAGGRRAGCRESKLILQQINERALNPSSFPTNTRTITIIVVMVMTPIIMIVMVLNIYHHNHQIMVMINSINHHQGHDHEHLS